MSPSHASPRRSRAGLVASVVLIVGGLAVGEALALPAVALTSLNALRAFDTQTPGSLGAPMAVTGLGLGEDLLGIDFRPATNQLFGLGNLGQVYRISLTTGAATAVGGPLDPATVPLNGNSFGFDFNPTVDRIRVVSDLGENYRLNPNDGTLTAVDGPLAFAAGDPNAATPATVTASGYTNNDIDPGTGTTLFGIDTNLGVLVRQDPPNAGTLVTVGPIGVQGQPLFAGFDIGGALDAFALTSFDPAFGSLPEQNATLYRLNLTSGAATSVGLLGTGSDVITGFAIVSAIVPEPTTLAAVAAGAFGLVRRRR